MSRLGNSEIVIMRSLALRCGMATAGVSLANWQREHVVPLWRRELVNIWFRQAPGTQPALQGPYFSLSVAGFALASHFLPQHAETPAPRGFSGAELKR